jgi:hypothetical protein
MSAPETRIDQIVDGRATSLGVEFAVSDRDYRCGRVGLFRRALEDAIYI